MHQRYSICFKLTWTYYDYNKHAWCDTVDDNTAPSCACQSARIRERGERDSEFETAVTDAPSSAIIYLSCQKYKCIMQTRGMKGKMSHVVQYILRKIISDKPAFSSANARSIESTGSRSMRHLNETSAATPAWARAVCERAQLVSPPADWLDAECGANALFALIFPESTPRTCWSSVAAVTRSGFDRACWTAAAYEVAYGWMVRRWINIAYQFQNKKIGACWYASWNKAKTPLILNAHNIDVAPTLDNQILVKYVYQHDHTVVQCKFLPKHYPIYSHTSGLTVAMSSTLVVRRRCWRENVAARRNDRRASGCRCKYSCLAYHG